MIRIDEIPFPKRKETLNPTNSCWMPRDALSKADPGKKDLIPNILDKVVQYLIVSSTSPFQCKGNGMVKFNDLVKSVFRLSNLINITIVEGSYQS